MQKADYTSEKQFRFFLTAFLLLFFYSCSKEKSLLPDKEATEQSRTTIMQAAERKSSDRLLVSATCQEYLIPKGQHYCGPNLITPITAAEMKFAVKFDSSAIYKTTIPINQYDINKLYGSSDNNAHHHDYSARFGWRWSDGALRLFAYVYDGGTRGSKEMGTIIIGPEINCSIKITASSYSFTFTQGLITKTTIIQRIAANFVNLNYKLYPYFGGDEVAPHNIRICIKDL